MKTVVALKCFYIKQNKNVEQCHKKERLLEVNEQTGI